MDIGEYMAAMDTICHWFGIDSSQFSKWEIQLLEVELFSRICAELVEIFIVQYKEYFRLLKCRDIEMENMKMESDYVRLVINDILSTGEYTLAGIAFYTQTPEEIICDIAIGKNVSPSATLLRKIIEMHRSVRREFYDAMIKRIKDKMGIG